MQYGITPAGFRRLAQVITDEIRDHYYDRTDRHVKLVQKYCAKIADAWEGFEDLVERGKEHDASKYEEPELTPYIWLTWRYKCKDDGVECDLPPGMEEEINRATEHHILHNAHHPESSQGETTDLVNKEDRDKPPEKMVDATGMSDLDIAEMCADWCAMSEERGNTPQEWAAKNVNIRWKFNPEQENLIFELIDSVWEDE